MSASRISNSSSNRLALLLMFAVVLVSVSFAIRPGEVTARGNLLKKEAGFSNVVSNTSLPLPPGKQTQLYYAARGSSDFYQRHSGWKIAAPVPVAHYPDYFERHPELKVSPAIGVGSSDYFMRHPELTAPAKFSADLTDYFFRHQAQVGIG